MLSLLGHVSPVSPSFFFLGVFFTTWMWPSVSMGPFKESTQIVSERYLGTVIYITPEFWPEYSHSSHVSPLSESSLWVFQQGFPAFSAQFLIISLCDLPLNIVSRFLPQFSRLIHHLFLSHSHQPKTLCFPSVLSFQCLQWPFSPLFYSSPSPLSVSLPVNNKASLNFSSGCLWVCGRKPFSICELNFRFTDYWVKVSHITHITFSHLTEK